MTATIIQLQKKEAAKFFICSACGAARGCNCNAPAVEKLVQKHEQDRQRSRAYRERKAEANQQPRHVTDDLGATKADDAYSRPRRPDGRVDRRLEHFPLSVSAFCGAAAHVEVNTIPLPPNLTAEMIVSAREQIKDAIKGLRKFDARLAAYCRTDTTTNIANHHDVGHATAGL